MLRCTVQHTCSLYSAGIRAFQMEKPECACLIDFKTPCVHDIGCHQTTNVATCFGAPVISTVRFHYERLIQFTRAVGTVRRRRSVINLCAATDTICLVSQKELMENISFQTVNSTANDNSAFIVHTAVYFEMLQMPFLRLKNYRIHAILQHPVPRE